MVDSIVFLVLRTDDGITMPVGFRFSLPEPARKTWRIQDDTWGKKGIIRAERPRSLSEYTARS